MTYLEVVTLDVPPTFTTVSFIVPGHQQWRPRSFHAVANKVVGGSPIRSYVLNISDGTNTVASVGAVDDGAEPGTCEVTWAPTQAAHSSSGTTGVTVAPLAEFLLPAGYEIDLIIVNPAIGDGWLSAVAWVDYSYSAT